MQAEYLCFMTSQVNSSTEETMDFKLTIFSDYI